MGRQKQYDARHWAGLRAEDHARAEKWAAENGHELTVALGLLIVRGLDAVEGSATLRERVLAELAEMDAVMRAHRDQLQREVAMLQAFHGHFGGSPGGVPGIIARLEAAADRLEAASVGHVPADVSPLIDARSDPIERRERDRREGPPRPDAGPGKRASDRPQP